MMRELKIEEKPYHIDVMLDLPAKDERRDCMKRQEISRVFREFKKPDRDDNEGTWNSFFRHQGRAGVFDDAVPAAKPIFPEMQHLRVYLLDPRHALRLELRRLADPDSDQGTKKASLDIAREILWGLTKNPESGSGGKRIYVRPWNNVDVPEASIKEVEDHFCARYKMHVSNPPVRN